MQDIQQYKFLDENTTPDFDMPTMPSIIRKNDDYIKKFLKGTDQKL